VDWLVENFTERNGIPCRLDVDGEDDRAPERAGDRGLPDRPGIARERRQARAGANVTVSIESADGMLTVRIVDDGAGFSLAAPRKPQSFGLLGLRERALLSGGDVVDRRARRARARRSSRAYRCRLPRHDPRRHRRRPHDPARGLKQLLAAEPTAGRGRGARRLRGAAARARRDFDVLLLDLSMPGRSGMDLIKQVRSEKPKLRILVLSMHAERQYAVRAVKAGASGYLTKDSASMQLVAAIRKVAAGGAFISAEVAEQLARSAMPHAEGPPHAALSDREYQVFQLLVAGKSVSDIAAELILSVKTVSTHKAHVFEKMGLANQAELIHYAIRHRLADDSAAVPVTRRAIGA
jgi:DNA-binding NarL/FixJ family response regulator